MSHSHGAVLCQDGTIFYFEYNGTVDVCENILRDSSKEVQDHWRETNYKIPNCSHPREKVRIATSYGGGFSWDGEICRICKLITAGTQPDYDTEEDGMPNWWLEKMSSESRKWYEND